MLHHHCQLSPSRRQRGQQQRHGSPVSDGGGWPQHRWRHLASTFPLPQGGQHPVGGTEGVQGGGGAAERQSQRQRCDITHSHASLIVKTLLFVPLASHDEIDHVSVLISLCWLSLIMCLASWNKDEVKRFRHYWSLRDHDSFRRHPPSVVIMVDGGCLHPYQYCILILFLFFLICQIPLFPVVDCNSAFPLLSLDLSFFHNPFPFGWAAAIFKGKPLPGSLIEGSKYSFPSLFVC